MTNVDDELEAALVDADVVRGSVVVVGLEDADVCPDLTVAEVVEENAMVDLAGVVEGTAGVDCGGFTPVLGTG